MKFLRVILLSFVAAAAVSGCGKSNGPTSVAPSLDSTPPNAPETMTVTLDPVTRSRTLSWAPSTAPDLAGYELYLFSPDPTRDNSFTLVAELDVTTNSYQIPTVSRQRTNFYRVRSVDESGNRSGYSPVYEINLYPVAPGGIDMPHGTLETP